MAEASHRTEDAREPTVKELFDLTGRSALMTGGTGWLGGAMARALAEAGARVVIASSRDADVAQRAADALPTPAGQRHVGVRLDHLSERDLDRGFDEAVERGGGLDVLVNNGRAPLKEGWRTVTAAQFTQHLANTTGCFLLARRMRDHAVQRARPASIINIGSMYAQVGSYPDVYTDTSVVSPPAYHAFKGGLVQLTRHLAVYWARDGVRVNALSPGPFPGGAIDPLLKQRLREKVPLGRMGRPHELKGALLLLASDAGSYLTGQNLTVDGGWCAW